MKNNAPKDFHKAATSSDEEENFGMSMEIQPEIKDIRLTRLPDGGLLGRFMFAVPRPIYDLDKNGRLVHDKNKYYDLERMDGLPGQLGLPAMATPRQIKKRLVSLLRKK